MDGLMDGNLRLLVLRNKKKSNDFVESPKVHTLLTGGPIEERDT